MPLGMNQDGLLFSLETQISETRQSLGLSTGIGNCGERKEGHPHPTASMVEAYAQVEARLLEEGTRCQ